MPSPTPYDMRDCVNAIDAVDISTTDATLGAARFLRANGAGNIVLRAYGSAADVTVPAKDGEYVPVGPGTIVRKTGTTVTGLHVFGG